MEIITFYSYKGGVGRTLLLSNIANFLSKLGKRVFVLDFDLEAPGIHHKFKIDSIKIGFIDYVNNYFLQVSTSIEFKEYVKQINNNLFVLPAGNAPSSEYAKKLSQVNWHNFYYKDEENITNVFFENLFNQIKTFSPDYILIDARTGLSDIGGYVIRKYTNKLVCLFLNNPENISGTCFILKSVNSFNKEVDIFPVLSRIPDEEIAEKILKDIQKEFENYTSNKYQIHYLHSQSNLEIVESLQLSGNNILRNSIILQDYLLFFQKLFPYESSQYQPIIEIIENKGKYKSSLISYNNSIATDKKSFDAFNSFKEYPKKILRAIGPKYYIESILNNERDNSGFNDLILEKLKNSLGFSELHNITSKDINWDLLGFELQEKAFDFCRDIYYLTKTRSHLSDILQIGKINTFTLFLYSGSPLYTFIKEHIKEINEKSKDKRLNYCFQLLIKNFNDFAIATMGDQAAASESYRLLSKLRTNNESKSFYEKITPKKDEIELLDWISGIDEKEKSQTDCLNSRIIICDHVTAYNILIYANSKDSNYNFACSSINESDFAIKKEFNNDSDLEFEFVNEIPAGYIYLKDSIYWRYYLAKAISEVLLEKGGEEYWSKLSEVFRQNKIIPFSFDEMITNLIWDIKLEEAIIWIEKIKKIKL